MLKRWSETSTTPDALPIIIPVNSKQSTLLDPINYSRA